MLHELVLSSLPLVCFVRYHAFVEESLLPGYLDLMHPFDGLQGFDHQVPIIARWNIASLFELEHCVVGHFLSVRHPRCFGPFELSGVFLGFEQLVALAGAEPELLRVVADEHGAVAGVDLTRAEVALINSHF